MDFEPRYTQEQEEFRKEVREWLKENVSPSITHPPDSINITEEQYQLRRDLGPGLGSKGWLWPTAPVEYGGGGLDVDHAVVIEEVVDAYGLTVPPYYDSGGRLGGASIMVWGTEEQKQAFLPQIFRGEVRPGSCSPNPTQGQTWPTPRCPPNGTATTISSTDRKSTWAVLWAQTTCGPSPALTTKRPDIKT